MLKCFEGENTSMCEAIRQMVDEGIMLGEKRGEERGEKRVAKMLTKQEVEKAKVKAMKCFEGENDYCTASCLKKKNYPIARA